MPSPAGPLSDPADEAFLEALNRALAEADLPAAPPGGGNAGDRLLVYVVGLPRSGTTLMSQLVARHLDVGYITNLAARFWRRPGVGVRLSRMVLGPAARESIELVSHQARTPGAAGPNEFGYFWRHWLRLDEAPSHALDTAHLARLDAAGLRRAIREEIIAAFGSAVMLKNVICGLQAEFLTRLHPASLFVHITRPLDAVVRSILAARRQRFGRYDAWWSVKPAGFPWPGLGRDPVADVLRQCRGARDGMAGALGADGVRTLELRYEELCRDPAGALQRLVAVAAELGKRVSILSPPPPALAPSPGPPLPGELEAHLRALVNGPPAAMLP
jgi:LPS sulfotransferase NodH